MAQTMKWISIVLGVVGFFFGLIAAYYWYKSSTIDVIPAWRTEPADTLQSEIGWNAATMNAITESARLNKRASLWTAGSVVLTAASSFVALWTPLN